MNLYHVNVCFQEKITNLKRQREYTENALSEKLKESSQKLKATEEKVEDLTFRSAKLQKDNKSISSENTKLNDKLKDTMQIKEHEDIVTHLKVGNVCYTLIFS